MSDNLKFAEPLVVHHSVKPDSSMSDMLGPLGEALGQQVKEATLSRHETHFDRIFELIVVVAGDPIYAPEPFELITFQGMQWHVKKIEGFKSAVMPGHWPTAKEMEIGESIEQEVVPIEHCTKITMVGVVPMKKSHGYEDLMIKESGKIEMSFQHAVPSGLEDKALWKLTHSGDGKPVVKKLDPLVILEPGDPEPVDYMKAIMGPVVFGVRMPSTSVLVDIKLMKSKYEGNCKTCGLRFPRGMPVAWNKVGGARHVGCWLRDTAGSMNPGSASYYIEAADGADHVTETVLLWYEEARPAIAAGECDKDSPEACDHALRCHCSKAPWTRLEWMLPSEVA